MYEVKITVPFKIWVSVLSKFVLDYLAGEG